MVSALLSIGLIRRTFRPADKNRTGTGLPPGNYCPISLMMPALEVGVLIEKLLSLWKPVISVPAAFTGTPYGIEPA
jgi:hypothetical protein